jgi:hypothetical protein
MLRLYFSINILYGIIVRVEADIGYFAKLGHKGSDAFKILLIFKKYSYSTRIYFIKFSSRLYLFSRKYK